MNIHRIYVEKYSEFQVEANSLKAELNEKVEAAKVALKDVSEKFQSIAAGKTDSLKEFAAVAFKSLKAGWDEAKKTFDQEKK